MASGVEKKITKHLQCAKCLETFKESKMLTCQHSYCKRCLERLVTVDDLGDHEITCPECRQKTQVPRGNISSLPFNFPINKLHSELDGQPAAFQVCSKHKGKKFKLLCQTCDQLICKGCSMNDHRDHHYKFVNNVYPAKKDKIAKVTLRDEEYTLVMSGGISEENIFYASKKKVFISIESQTSWFEIQSKKDNTYKPHWAEAVDDVQVNIKQTGSNDVDSPVIKRNWSGSFTFSYRPADVGMYKIEVLVNGRYLEGSPFIWEVKMFRPSEEDKLFLAVAYMLSCF